MQDQSKTELTRQAAERYVLLHKERTLGAIQGDLALANKMADSEALRVWIRNPKDAAITPAAMRELASFLSLYSRKLAFLASAAEMSFLITRGENLKVILENQGVVPAEIRESFFEKFATAGKPGGTGLGTYSAKLLTEAQGGEHRDGHQRRKERNGHYR